MADAPGGAFLRHFCVTLAAQETLESPHFDGFLAEN
jgi:hypothetical protein